MSEQQSGYDWYLEMKRKYAENNDSIIKQVIAEKVIPQHILLAKTVSSKFENEAEEIGFLKQGEKFYFTERMVNMLMYFSYIQGTHQINEESFRQGWDACLADLQKVFAPVAEKLDFVKDDEG